MDSEGTELDYVFFKESNMHWLEGHHFASPVAPNFPWGKTVNSCRRSCRNSKTSHRKRAGGERGGFPAPAKGQFLRERGARRRHKMVTTIWCRFV